MQTNATPTWDTTDNPTGCCPRFQAEPWDGQVLHFVDKPFVKASTISFFHIPLNMGSVFTKTFGAIERAHAEGGFLVMTHEDSPWHAEHLFAVSHDVPGQDVVRITGDFFTKVFEGPFSDAPKWAAAMRAAAAERGTHMSDLYFFYPTCPKCSKVYGKNYVVGIGQITP